MMLAENMAWVYENQNPTVVGFYARGIEIPGFELDDRGMFT